MIKDSLRRQASVGEGLSDPVRGGGIERERRQCASGIRSRIDRAALVEAIDLPHAEPETRGRDEEDDGDENGC
jgi:hypothetical protein